MDSAMNIENRMHDVVKLRCRACQEFFGMIVKDDWRQKLYVKAKEANETNSKYKSTYEPSFQLMRSKGIEKYQIEDMDVTLITALAIYEFDGRNAISKKTREVLNQLKEDRNETNHSGENEEPDELYLRALLSLCDLKKFVIAVDKYENTIDDSTRLFYRQKYIKQIDELKCLLDDERIELVYRKKEINADVKRIIESKEPQKMFVHLLEFNRRFLTPDNYENHFKKYYDFLIAASDAGIVYAHDSAASYYIQTKDYAEAERRMLLLHNSKDCDSVSLACRIVSCINEIIRNGDQPTLGMNKMVNELRRKGCVIVKTEAGTYQVSRN